jgi:hypothetical protein
MPALAKAAPAATKSDLEALQGVWTSVAGPREARFLIAGSRFTFEFVGGELYMVEEGPADHKGLVAPCIYQVDAGVLKWCPGRIGSGRRLSAFPSVDDERYLCLIFRRARRTNGK